MGCHTKVLNYSFLNSFKIWFNYSIEECKEIFDKLVHFVNLSDRRNRLFHKLIVPPSNGKCKLQRSRFPANQGLTLCRSIVEIKRERLEYGRKMACILIRRIETNQAFENYHAIVLVLDKTELNLPRREYLISH